jgi:signal transduction histidine kinase
MKALLADTLFKRLFALMWLALVISNAVAFFAIALNVPMIAAGPLPIFPSLPPVSFAHHPAAPPAGASAVRGVPGDRGGFGEPGGLSAPSNQQDAMGWPPPMPTQPAGARRDVPGDSSHEFGLSTTMTLLDYGIRLLIIGLAAWLGARWLSAPMRRLQSASRALGQSLARSEVPPALDERAGTVEVRETAHVFNEMSRQLGEQVNSRALLVAAISHDLRTPLTRIRMRLEGSEDDPLTARSIADIHEMDDLIESALEVFRGSGAHEEASEVTDVHALVQALVDDLADLGQPVSVRGDAAQARVQTAALRRVVSNLVNNALRYGKRADVGVHAVGDEVRIVIEDEGPGIAPAQLEAVMQPFYRIEASRNRLTGGSGLGLYIARDLLARQGGTLTLENRPEGGLRATIAFRRAELIPRAG